jgi:hypothetical protein
MGFNVLMALTSPVTWLLVAGFVAVWRHARGRRTETRRSEAAEARGDTVTAGRPRRGVMRGTAMDVGAAFLFLSTAYRPSHAFLMRAQIRQVEDVDEDDQGGPDTPARRLQRQLRQIRRGEPIDRLVFQAE